MSICKLPAAVPPLRPAEGSTHKQMILKEHVEPLTNVRVRTRDGVNCRKNEVPKSYMCARFTWEQLLQAGIEMNLSLWCRRHHRLPLLVPLPRLVGQILVDASHRVHNPMRLPGLCFLQ